MNKKIITQTPIRDYRLSKSECNRIITALIGLEYIDETDADEASDYLYDAEVELDS